MNSVKLLNACEICTGKLDSNAAESGGKYPFFTCSPEPLKINTYAFDEDAILLAGNNAQGNFHIQRYNGKFNAYQRTYVITAKSGWDIDFVKYSIEIALNHLKKIAQGSQTKFLTLGMLEDFYLKDYSLDKQKQIAAPLKTIDDKIALNNHINDNLAQMLNLVYEQWFYRFEFPNAQNLPYKQSNGELEWNEKIKRHIPQGWKVQSMMSNDLFSVISSGIEPFTSKRYYATADIIGSDIGEGSSIVYETRESRANMQPAIYSVWFAKMKNSVKHLLLNPEMLSFIESSILSTGFYGLQCSEMSFEYISSVVSSPIFEATKDRLSHGATQQGITDDDLANISLLVPDEITLSKYHDATKGLYSQISNNILENKRLIAIRNFLLPLLMNGQAIILD